MIEIMKKIIFGLTILLTFASTSATAGEEEDIQKAVVAAEAWLTLVDQGKFAESWDRAARPANPTDAHLLRTRAWMR